MTFFSWVMWYVPTFQRDKSNMPQDPKDMTGALKKFDKATCILHTKINAHGLTRMTVAVEMKQEAISVDQLQNNEDSSQIGSGNNGRENVL